jgi:hypothetical protein
MSHLDLKACLWKANKHYFSLLFPVVVSSFISRFTFASNPTELVRKSQFSPMLDTVFTVA